MTETSSSRTTQTTLSSRDARQSVPDDYEGQLGNGEDIPTVIESDGDEERCPYCGEWYNYPSGWMSRHWNGSGCPWPPISSHKMEIMKGMVLGDGSMDTENGCFQVTNTNKTFLEWLDRELGWLTSGVSMQKTAVESARRLRENLGRETQSEDALDCYQLSSRTHPQLQQFVEWYSTGEIVFPMGLTVSPIALKMWYVSDGGLKYDNPNASVRIFSVNEKNRPAQIFGALQECGFTVSQSGKDFRVSTADTEDFFDYIGNPVPGFEYKWAWQDRDRYDRLKDECREKHCTQTVEESS